MTKIVFNHTQQTTQSGKKIYLQLMNHDEALLMEKLSLFFFLNKRVFKKNFKFEETLWESMKLLHFLKNKLTLRFHLALKFTC